MRNELRLVLIAFTLAGASAGVGLYLGLALGRLDIACGLAFVAGSVIFSVASTVDSLRDRQAHSSD